MKNFYKLLGSITLALVLYSIAACGSDSDTDTDNSPGDNPNNTDTGPGNTPGDDSHNVAFKYDENEIKNKLGDNYWIIYEATEWKDGAITDTTFIEQRRTPEGFYWDYPRGEPPESGGFYIKNAGNYDWYIKNPEGGYFQYPGQLTEEEAESNMDTFAASLYMSWYTEYRSQLKSAGSEQVTGRDCEKYTYTLFSAIDDINLQETHTYSIDKATGACLKYTLELTGNAMKQDTYFEFVCTKFQMGGVSLPPYP
ncbi:MAG: hypothetical protein FWG75_06625 [Cystobacterineae bacterium]|nr:hypothetical protein [Cystobacterineae bacterium]